eukprot:TRINITY_DN42929_c0_g1_i1.p1 TRINITY_DN42929_c0_g1~~TRINITY_DN42929_c0_g1_i1.p1  ORF type:complete len:2522 (-),score=443.44 TRINITY_DN42929_c0_g1_i1:439-8004(-)
MLEGILEKILLKCLDPYVDGIARDKLRLGVFSGTVELKSLNVKRDAPALLGVDYLRVDRGRIDLIKISVPWKALFSGKVSVTVSGIECTFDNVSAGRTDIQVLDEMRQAKRKTIELRAQQLQTLMEKEHTYAASGAPQSEDAKKKNVGIVRKIINNLQIDIASARVAFKSKERGFAAGAQLSSLCVLSADSEFRTGAARSGENNEEIPAHGKLYKVLNIEDLSVQMSPANSSDLCTGSYVLEPMKVGLHLAHVPSEQVLQLRLFMAEVDEKAVSFRLERSKSKHLFALLASMQQEKQRLEELIAPPAVRQALIEDGRNGAVGLEEYGRLYRRLALEQGGVLDDERPLSKEEQTRMHHLEDLMPVLLLARQRNKVQATVAKLTAEVDRRMDELVKQKKQPGFFGRLWGRKKPETKNDNANDLITKEERELLLTEIHDETKVEPIPLPSRLEIEVSLGNTVVDLVDDKWSEGSKRQLLHVNLGGAVSNVAMAFCEDHRGNNTVEFCIEGRLLQFSAMQQDKLLVRSVAPAAVGPACLDRRKAVQHAALVSVENRLDKDRSVLRLCVDLVPLHLCALPDILEPVIDFFKAPNDAAGPGSALVRKGEEKSATALQQRELVEFSKQLLATHAMSARDVAEQVYKRLPDATEIEVTVASPVIEVSTREAEQATISLGRLRLATPQPCAYNAIELDMHLHDAMVMTRSARGEQFDMLQPVPIGLKLLFSSSEAENRVKMDVQVKQMLLKVAPQACRILVQVPAALSASFAKRGTVPAEPANSKRRENEPLLEKGATGFAMLSEVVTDVAATDDTTKKVLKRASETVEAARRARFVFALSVSLDTFELTLAESIMPVARLNLRAPKPGFTMELCSGGTPQQQLEKDMTCHMVGTVLEMDVLNHRHGYFEPLMERFSFDLDVTRKPDKGKDGVVGGRRMNIVVSGNTPLLVDLSPTAVRISKWYFPLFLSSIRNVNVVDQKQEDDAAHECGSGCKYKVVNLCNRPFMLTFYAHDQAESFLEEEVGLSTAAEPWKSIDEWVLPNFAESITVRMQGDGGAFDKPVSASLPLNMGDRTVIVPSDGDDIFAELLTPHPGTRVLLLGSSLRIHNKTDLRLAVRFHDTSHLEAGALGKAPTLPGVHASLPCCDAALLGLEPSSCSAWSALVGGDVSLTSNDDCLLLAPNAICAVPTSARFGRSKESEVAFLQTLVSVRRADFPGDSFSAATRIGRNVPAAILSCPFTDRRTMSAMHLVCDAHTLLHPARITTIAFHPTLTLSNALPVGSLSVSIADGDGYSARDASVVKVPCLQRVNVYSCKGVLNHGVQIMARLEDTVPWSGPVTFANVMGSSQNDEGQRMDVKKSSDGASASVSVVPVGRLELRFECPQVFSDRSGVSSSYHLELWHGNSWAQAPLPSYDGITLLPRSCLEEDCQLTLRSGAVQVSSRSLRMPASWHSFAWSPPSGPLVLCVQAEQMSAADLLGARCHVFTLRPRTVLTNASAEAIEVCCEAVDANRGRTSSKAHREVLTVSGGKSVVLHWKVTDVSDKAPGVAVSFRPAVGRADRPWSSEVVCSEVAAGSRALILPVPGAEPHVWSVDIAPSSGAIAVTVKQSSTYIARNDAISSEVVLSVSPLSDLDAKDGDTTFSVLPGTEMAFGWPLVGTSRAVNITLSFEKEGTKSQTRVRIDDVHVKKTRRFPDMQVVLTLRQEGDLKLVQLEDERKRILPVTVGAEQAPPAMTMVVEVKLGRLGLSLVQERPFPRELVYMQLDLIRFNWQSDGRLQDMNLLISEAQVDCQLPGRVDRAVTAEQLRAQTHESFSLMSKRRKAVLAANCADLDRPFMTLAMQLGMAGRDLIIPRAELRMDTLDIVLDDEWIQNVQQFFKDTSDDVYGGGGLRLKTVLETAGVPIEHSFTPPPVPRVVQLDTVKISGVEVQLWAMVSLASVHFLPPFILHAIRVISLSGQLTLDGGRISLPLRNLRRHRGSLAEFLKGLGSEYTMSFISAAASVLGSSSLLNLPRVPLQLGGHGVSYIGDTIHLASDVTTSTLQMLTFDSEYQERQRAIRANKKIDNAGQGIVEASKSVLTGLSGVQDLVAKPVEGIKKGGFAGFFSGLGQGVVSAVAKPVAGIGQAVGDMSAGLTAQVTQAVGVRSADTDRVQGRLRSRLPRLLYCDAGIIRPWNAVDAEARRLLGTVATRHVHVILPLGPPGTKCPVVLLFGDHLMVVTIDTSSVAIEQQVGGSRTSRPSYGAAPQTEGAPEAILSHALKPLHMVKAGVTEAGKRTAATLFGADNAELVEPGDPEVLQRARILQFRDLKNVHVPQSSDSSGVGSISLEASGGTLNLPLTGVPRFGIVARNLLVMGFKEALQHAGRSERFAVDWRHFRDVVYADAFIDATTTSVAVAAATVANTARKRSSGEHVIEVYEHERTIIGTDQWQTPFMPYDFDASWRWLNAYGKRHPSLIKGIKREAAASSKTPPCHCDLLQLVGKWEVIVQLQETDKDGWQYSISSHSATWQNYRGMLDTVRRRRWTGAFG